MAKRYKRIRILIEVIGLVIFILIRRHKSSPGILSDIPNFIIASIAAICSIHLLKALYKKKEKI